MGFVLSGNRYWSRFDGTKKRGIDATYRVHCPPLGMTLQDLDRLERLRTNFTSLARNLSVRSMYLAVNFGAERNSAFRSAMSTFGEK